MTRWIGDMGIVSLRWRCFHYWIGGIELFVAEAPGPTADKIHPRIKETAKGFWFMYFMLTVILSVILTLKGMTVFDSVNHAFATMATGGFPLRIWVSHFNSPAIEYTISLFMFIAGCKFIMVYYLYKRKYKRVWQDDEFRYYTLFIWLQQWYWVLDQYQCRWRNRKEFQIRIIYVDQPRDDHRIRSWWLH